MPLILKSEVDDSVKHDYDVNHLLYWEGKLYTAGDDGKIKAFSPDLKLLTEVQAHPCSVFWLAASHDTLYSCSNEGTVKCFDIKTLQHKKTLIQDPNTEFWRIAYTSEGCLFVGDHQGSIRVFKDDIFYGGFSIAEPVKDMLLDGHIMFTSNVDIIATEVKLLGKKIQYGNLKCMNGRSPIALVGDKLFFTNREGRDIIVHDKSNETKFKEVSEIKGAHELIINAMAGAVWDSKMCLFTGGWDKEVKLWKIENDEITAAGSCKVNIAINAIAVGEKGKIYVGGGDGKVLLIEQC